MIFPRARLRTTPPNELIPAGVASGYVAAWLQEWAGEREGFAVVGPYDDGGSRILILQPGGRHVLITLQDAELAVQG